MAELLRSLEGRRLYQVVADRIRASIDDGSFPPLSRLPAERELAQILGVSRPSLREALIALEIEGRVDVRMGSGVYVAAEQEPTGIQAKALGDSPSEIMQARMALEGAVVTLACARITPRSLQGLRDLLQTMHRISTEGGVPLAQDRAFHLLLAETAGNSVLTRLIGALFDSRQDMMLAALRSKFESGASWRAALVEHQAILAALEAADPLQAQAAMRMHLQYSAERWLGR